MQLCHFPPPFTLFYFAHAYADMDQNASPSPSSRLDDGEHALEHRAKRRKVKALERKRVAKACSSCRRLKEKCDGRIPCSRCVRYGRTCGSVTTGLAVAASTTVESRGDISERVAYLETIARHFLGETPLETENLQRVVQSLGAQSQGSISQTSPESQSETHSVVSWGHNVARPSANGFTPDKLSHLGFVRILQDEVYQRLNESAIRREPAHPLKSPSCASLLSNVEFSRADLPPKDVALSLSGVYFDFAHTACLWVERSWAEEKIERLYDWTTILAPEDYGWICSVVLILAVAVLFAHLADKTSEDDTDASVPQKDTLPSRDASIKFYRMASELVPDLLLHPGIDALQAFVIFSHFALSWNAPGLAYDYLGVASHVAAQIDLYNTDRDDPPSRDLLRAHNRLRQVIYIWEERIGIQYGVSAYRPLTKIDDAAARSTSADTHQQQISPEASTNLMVQLTDWLGDIADVVSKIDQCDQSSLAPCLEHVMAIRRHYKHWWSNLDISRIPILQLHRYTAPLRLCHHMNIVIMGRSLILASSAGAESPGSSPETQNAIAELVDDAEYSAYEIIDICAMLDQSIGLAPPSYVEFSTCQAAVLVMLAQSLVGRCHLFRGKLQQGMDLLRKMERTQAESTSDTSATTSIYDAISTLEPHRRNQKYNKTSSIVNSKGGFQNFQDWAKDRCRQFCVGTGMDSTLTIQDGDQMLDLQGMFSSSAFDSSVFGFDPNDLLSVDHQLDVY